jgi:hypothetical protein
MKYYIYSAQAADADDGAGFWSNTYGWVLLEDADEFAAADPGSLPMGYADVRVVDETEAQRLAVASDRAETSLRVTIDVRYTLGGDDASTLAGALERSVTRFIGDGLLTDATDATVRQYQVNVDTCTGWAPI